MSNIDEIADALSTELSITVFYGMAPDEVDGSLDTVLTLRDFPFYRPQHAFGVDEPVIDHFGILVTGRAPTQDAARSLCEQGYSALLGMGYLAISPVVAQGLDESGRFTAAAEVEAYSISS